MAVQLLDIHEPGETPLPHADDPLAVGIDLGTTNSLVAFARDGKAEVLRDIHGNGILPSVVAYGDPILVGHAAVGAMLEAPDRAVSSIKRLMGRGPDDVKALGGTLPYEVLPAESGRMVRLKVAGRVVTPVEVSAEILKALKSRAEDLLGKAVGKAVITVPAYFDDAARAATKDAAKLADLEVLRLVNEPTAAALAYGLDKGSEGVYAVYDLGGGTFDISLLRLEKGVFQVLATGGDSALGGDDFDHALAEHVLAGRTLDRAASKRALVAARRAKEALTGAKSAELEGKAVQRAQFESLIAPMVERTLAACRQVLDDASLTAQEIDGVVLVGGSTRVPYVRRKVAELFGKPPLADIDPDEVVAVGAALQAEALTAGSETLLLDVIPLSLGIETMGGIVEKVIERNTTIPTAQAQEFTTYQDGQTAMAIHVVQGEREMSDQCRSLARFELRGIPPLTAGAARIRVTFAVDADGLLTVSAQELSTGVQAEVAVKPSYGLTPEEMESMLRASFEHARTDMETRFLTEARVDARRVLLAAKGALASDADLLSAEERTDIDNRMAEIERLIAGEDREAITGAIEAFDKATQDFAGRRMDRGIARALSGIAIDRLERQLGPGS
jgi:molecular chaperone HscA